MTGDANDMLTRLRALLPPWFPNQGFAPVLDGALTGIATTLAFLYSLYAYAQLQTRIATATDAFLDLIAYDYLGFILQRNGASDAVFGPNIRATILQERVTRAGMISALIALTGKTPVIFEPWNPEDTGCYGGPACGYGVAGGYGSVNLPGQVFIKAYRGAGSGVPNIGGYGSPPGGYGVGALEYIGPDIELSGITDDDIYETVSITKPAGVTAWVAID
jgi:hypothetical protein